MAQLTVKYSDIDINRHVNSMRYIQWLTDLFDIDKYKKNRIKRFEINYVNESFWGDDIQIYQYEKQPDEFFFEIKKEEKQVCKARIVWITSE